MTGNDGEEPEDPLADALAAYDDLLASGRETPPEALDEAVDPPLLPEWNRLAAFLTLVEKAWPRDASGSDPPTEPTAREGEAGGQFGRFRIIRTLGQGGFGIVFLAWDQALRRQVALKVPQPEALITPEVRKRFLREARAAAGLDHPNIVPMYEGGSVGTVAYIASAYCPGPTLAEWLACQPQPVPSRDAASLIATVARAVEHAHERGVLHRDLKPSNILLHRPGAAETDNVEGHALADFQPRITDFSLAWLADGEGPKTLSGVPLGSPPYMAPEQAEGRLRAIGPPTDVYGLGCVLYELLMGHPPFLGESQVETLRKVIADDPPPPRRLRRDVPSALEAIVLKCLAKDPARRYPAARELADDLDRFLAGEPTRARPPSLSEKVMRTAGRHPAALIVLAISTVFAGALLIGGRWYADRLDEGRRLARQRDDEARRRELDLRRTRYVADLRQVPQYIRLYQTRYAHESLVRHRPRPGEEDLREFAWYHLWLRCHQERRTLPGPRDVVYSVEFSPKGDLLASAVKDGTVLVWDTADWRPFGHVEASPKEVNAAAFSPDGRTLATADDEGKLKLWEVATRRLQWEKLAHKGDAVVARFSPDGKRIITAGRNDGTIRIWDRTTGTVVTSLQGHGGLLSPDGGTLATVGADGEIGFHDSTTLVRIGSLPRASGVQDAAFSHDGTKLATAHGGDRMVRLWEVSSRRLLRDLRGHTDGAISVAFSSDDRTILAGGHDGIIRSWDVATGAERGVWLGHIARVWAIAVSPGGRTIASAGADGTVKLWDTEPPRERLKLPIPNPASFRFSPDGRTLLTIGVGLQWSVARWDARSGSLLERAPLKPTSTYAAFAFSRDGRFLAISDRESTITLHDFVSGERRSLPDPGSRDVHILEFSPDDRYLLVARGQRLWDLSNHQLISFPWKEEAFVAFTATGHLVVAGLYSGNVRWWDPRTGRSRAGSLKPHHGVESITPSPDGRILASLDTYARRIHLWSADTLELKVEMPGHPEITAPLAFSPDGKTLASAGSDRTIKLWDVATGEEFLTLGGYTGTIWIVAFSPDGKALATLSSTGPPDNPLEIILWQAAGDDCDQAIGDPERKGSPAH